MTQFFSEAMGSRERSGFTSGQPRIDGYFRHTASQDVKRRYAACFVIVERESGLVAGFYTLSAATIPLLDLPEATARKLPRYPAVPAVLIGWLGRDLRFRGRNIGAMLLWDAITRIERSSIGAHAICADAIDEDAAAFNRKHQFIAFVSRPQSFFLPMATALAAARRPGHES